MRKYGWPALLAAGSLAFAWPALAKAPGQQVVAKTTFGTFGFDTAGMDRSIAPGADFGAYAGGTYLRTLVIPADRSDYGMFTQLHDLSQERTRTIVEAAAARKTNQPGSEAQKVGDTYASFLDEAAIEAKGLAPLQPYLDVVAAITDRSQLAQALGRASRQGVNVALGIGPQQDLKNPEVIAVYVGQGGLQLPDRDYYLDTKNPKFAELRVKYLSHIGAMLRLAGFDRPEQRAQGIFALETKLAEVHWSKVEERQMDKLYNPVQRTGLEAAYPGVDWTALLTALGLQNQKELIVAHPSAIQGTAKLMASEPLETWKDYLAFHTLKAAAPFLPKAIVAENFAFDGKILSGQPEIQPRWKRGVDLTTNALGEAVGKLYVAQYFPPEAKAQADLLVKYVIKAMDQRLAKLTWMAPQTKAAARAKLAKFTPKIGYPATWRNYAALEVKAGDALGNAMRATEFEFQRQVEKIGKPIDRTEWEMTPMTVNAYANPLWNEIVFPAAILQPPFFDAHADPAVNYGAIGVVIGHEISHHFDDQGRKFDLDGKLADWWTAEDVKRFTALTDKVVKQYAAYEPLKGSHVNGELTLGENMADLAGVNVALDAYHQSLKGKPAARLGGFSGDQRFFLGFAQVWRQKYRDEALLNQITTNPHTPGHLRPNVVRNLDAWYTAFDVKPGQVLYLAPADRIKVW
jgi:putative endopeptidase